MIDTHDIHGREVSFDPKAKGFKDIFRSDEHTAKTYFKDAEKHGKTHFEDEGGRKFTIEHDKESGSFHVRPKNI